MDKISSKKIAQVLHDAESALRAVAAERDEAVSKLASITRRMEVEKVAFAMHEKGINQDVEFDELVGSLEKAAEQGRLPIIQEAVGMMGKNIGIGTVNTDGDTGGTASSSLENYVLGHIG